jgi:hypothetical protein
MVTGHRRIICLTPAKKLNLEEIAARIARTRNRISDSGNMVTQAKKAIEESRQITTVRSKGRRKAERGIALKAGHG